MQKIHLIINGNASTGRAAGMRAELEKILGESGVEYEFHETHKPGDARELARTLSLSPDRKTIWVIGGDGTLNEAVNGLVINGTLDFGLIPAGSGNDFARGMNIPRKTAQALKKLLETKEVGAFDVGQLELIDNYVPDQEESGDPCPVTVRFAGSSGCGYDADVCYEVERSRLKKALNKLHLGKLVYFVIAFKQVFKNPRFHVTIINEGISRSFNDVVFISFMNHVYEGGGLKMAPGADPKDGKISVVMANNVSRFRVLTLLPSLLTGGHVKKNGVQTFETKEMEVIAEKRLRLHTDGEVRYGSKHFRVRCCPDRLRMPDTTKTEKAPKAEFQA